MGISLKSIELSNIRSHTHFKFVPADSGVTAISGPTGSGKSTIVDSLAWILYGTKPNGVNKNSSIFREGADFKVDKCYATAEIEVDGSLLKIERKMVSKAGGVKCDIWEWNLEKEEWEHRAGSATSHAEVYIRQRLKMDEKGFLTAVLVQQKQVDQLISSGPPERARVIEKLTGIASISSGISAARKEHSGIKKAIEVTSVDETQLEKVQADLLVAETKLRTLRKSYKKSKEKLQFTHGELKDFEAEVEEKVESFERAENARKVLGEVEVKLEASESVLEDAKAEKDEAKAQLPEGSHGVSFEESRSKLKALRGKVASLESSKLYQMKLLDSATKKVATLQEVVESSEHDSLKSTLSESTELLSSAESIASKLSKLRSEAGDFRGEISQLDSAREVVAKGDDCPTCRQSVDDVSVAVAALEAQKSKIELKLSKIEVKLEELVAEKNEVEQSQRSLKELAESFKSLEREKLAVSSAETEIAELAAELKLKSTELKTAEKLHRVLEREEENSLRYNAALERLQKVVKAIESLKSKRKLAESTLKETKAPSEQKLNSMRKKLYSLQVAYQDERVKLGEAKSEAKILSSSIEHLSEKREIYTAELDRHKELLKSAEASAATLETLTEFRADRVRTALPTIESYSSELLSRFTDGKFIALKLDEKFNASVVLSSGAERPVGMLSGGELSAASIALRLSVSMMLNSSDSSNLIILDEVLVSQDSDRSELILSTIRDVCKGQVVMIAHGDGVGAIADKKVELEGS